MEFRIKTALAFVCTFMFLQVLATEPLFENSVVSTEFDFIAADDPSAFKTMRYLGQGRREMPDKRSDELFGNDTYLFEASFRDRSKVQIWVHNAIGTKGDAERHALMLSGPLGKLPDSMRSKLSHVVIHRGTRQHLPRVKGTFLSSTRKT